MARDRGLEELIHQDLSLLTGIEYKAMFGGWAWLLHGHLLCGARADGMLVRLGKDLDAWALEMDGVVSMVSRGGVMQGWVRVPSLCTVTTCFGRNSWLVRLNSSAFYRASDVPALSRALAGAVDGPTRAGASRSRRLARRREDLSSR